MTKLQSAMLLVIFLLLSVTFYALYEERRIQEMMAPKVNDKELPLEETQPKEPRTKSLEEEPVNQSAEQEYKMIPILFYPNDVTPNLSYLDAINESMGVIQAWYNSQLNGKTFEWNPVIAQKGNHPLTWYRNEPSVIQNTKIQINAGKVVDDLEASGYSIRSSQSRVYVIFIQAETIGHAWLGGRIALMGEHVPRALVTNIEWEVNAARGVIAHEIGHAIGLRECPCGQFSPDVMCDWGNFPTVGLCNSSISTLLESPFFK